MREVVDRFKQRHNVDRVEPDLFEQHHGFEDVGDGPGHRDDALRDRALPEVADGACCCGEDTHFLARGVAKLRLGAQQWPRCAQLLDEHLHSVLLHELRVVFADTGCREHLRHDRLEGLGILPQIQRVQVEAEGGHGRAQAREPVIGDNRAAVRTQRVVDAVQVGEQFRGVSVWSMLVDAHLLPRQRRARRRNAVPDPVHGAAVGLVHAGLGGVVGGVGELGKLCRAGGIAVRQGKFALQGGQFVQVVCQRCVGGLAGGVGQRFGVDVRVAVVVAADPGARAKDRGECRDGPGGVGKQLLDGAVELRDLLEQRELVVAQADVNLVFEARARDADEGGLPQQGHAQLHLALDRLGVRTGVKLAEQAFDACLGVEDGAPARLGGVRGEHRRDLRAGDQFGDPICAHPTVVQVRERVAQRHRGGDLLVVQVLDEVGQQREVAKRAGDQVHVRDVQLAEHGEQVIRGGVAVRDVEGGAAGGFNQVEDFLALLFGDHPAKHPPEQSDVFTDVVCGLGWHVVSPYSFEFLSGVQHTT